MGKRPFTNPLALSVTVSLPRHSVLWTNLTPPNRVTILNARPLDTEHSLLPELHSLAIPQPKVCHTSAKCFTDESESLDDKECGDFRGKSARVQASVRFFSHSEIVFRKSVTFAYTFSFPCESPIDANGEAPSRPWDDDPDAYAGLDDHSYRVPPTSGPPYDRSRP